MLLKLITYSICFLACFSSCGDVHAHHTIQAVVFDFGKVIATQDKTELAEFFMKALELSRKEDLQTYLTRLQVFISLGGSEKNFWEQIANERGIQLSSEWFQEFEEIQKRSIKENPHMLQIVENLKLQGYKTPLLSNTSPSKAYLWNKYGYYDHFSPLLLSYAVGFEKPEPEIYEILLNLLDLPPSACLFIDDKAANIVAARQLGIDGILFCNAEQLIEELAERGIIINLANEE